MKAQEILRADLPDVLFENRNKSYGAYTLRRHYSRRLWMAIGATLVTALLGIWLVRPSKAENAETTASREVVIRNIELPKVETPPPVKEAAAPKKAAKTNATSKIQSQKIKKTQFTPPVIKKDEEVKQEELPPVADMATIYVVSQEGMTNDDLIASVPPIGTPEGIDGGNGIVTAPEEDPNKIFEKVEVEARVDQRLWRRHLENRLVRYIEDAAAEGMPSGQYTIMVRFLVERDGSIRDVDALNDPGYGLAGGAEQVVKTGPSWQPGIQNGRTVRSYHNQPITFVIMDS